MKILYHSYFSGWVVVTAEQKQNLIKHMRKGITAITGDKREEYINSRFKYG